MLTVLFIVFLSVVMLNVVIPSVAAPTFLPRHSAAKLFVLKPFQFIQLKKLGLSTFDEKVNAFSPFSLPPVGFELTTSGL
jgi:hypothetical protein